MARPYKDQSATKTGRSRLAQWWRDLRTGANLDQQAVAAAIGCSASHLSNIERGRRVPSFDLVCRYDEFVGGGGILRSIWEWAMAELAAERAGTYVPERGRQVPGDRSQFVRDLFALDGAVLAPLERFTKGWELRNVGSVPWRERFLRQAGPRAPLYAPIAVEERVPIPRTDPGETAEIKVEMLSPQLPGKSITYFWMIHSDGALCFPDRYADGIYARIEVREPIRLRT